MFLSIIIPIYNDEKYLAECLDSCLNQDISYDDYEIICVDDGSTDKTRDILNEYAEKYENIRLIFKEHGVGAGRNIGLEKAQGDYVWFVDHDDLIRENCLGLFKTKVYETNCDRLCFYSYDFFESLTDDEKRSIDKNELESNNRARVDAVVWCSVIRKAFMTDNGILPRTERLLDKKGWATDTFFIYDLKKNSPVETTISTDVFYFYRQHSGQENAITNLWNKFEGHVNLANIVIEDYKNLCDGDIGHDFVAKSVLNWIRGCSRYASYLPIKDFLKAKKVMKDLGFFSVAIPKKYGDNLKACMNARVNYSRIEMFYYYFSKYSFGVDLLWLSEYKLHIKRTLKSVIGKIKR